MSVKFFIEKLEQLTGKKVILEAKTKWAPIVLAYVTKNPGQTNKEILSGLGIPVLDSQKTNAGYSFSSAQGSALVNLRKLTVKGILSREKKGREFVYTLASTSSKPSVEVKVEPKKTKSNFTFEKALDLINQKWPYRSREGNKFEGQKGYSYLDFETGDRGPRTDHGGGEDGDGWMSDEQVRRIAKPYGDKWSPRLKQLEKDLAKEGLIVQGYVDYGEKGHVTLQLQIKTPLKESSLFEQALSGKLLYHSTDDTNAINILKSGEIKTYENILKATNQDPSEWYDDPNYGKFVYVSDFPHDENNYYGLSDLGATFVIDSNRIKHKMTQADRSYEGGTISVEGNIPLSAVVKVLIYKPNKTLIKLLQNKGIKYSIEALSSSLKETDSKYDNMRYYPDSHLHPLVQQSLKYQYERLKQLFPGLDNFNVKQDDDQVIRMHYTYKGKPYKTKVDLNGDTGERAFNAIKRNIAPKPKTGRFINTSNFRF